MLGSPLRIRRRALWPYGLWPKQVRGLHGGFLGDDIVVGLMIRCVPEVMRLDHHRRYQRRTDMVHDIAAHTSRGAISGNEDSIFAGSLVVAQVREGSP
jgi:hypothetical protein